MTGNLPTKRGTGFSLLELSIVLVVIGVLVSISLSLGNGQLQMVNLKSTQSKLDRIDQAVGLYLKTNNALPCPASGATAISVNSFGMGNKTVTVAEPPLRYNNITCPNANNSYPAGTPTTYFGVVPVRDLGLSDDYMFDGWGNRIGFAVSKYCLDSDNWSGLNLYRCSASAATTAAINSDGGSITIEDLSGTPNIRALSSSGTYLPGAAYVALSYGKNGIGAYPRVGGTTRISGSPNSLEEDNAHLSSTYDSIFRDGLINDGTLAARYFDDLVHWKTAARLWDDASATGSMPSCSNGNTLTSNGGTAWACADNSVPTWPAPAAANTDDLVNWNFSKSNSGSSTPSPVTIDTTGKKFISVSGQCTTVSISLAAASTTISLIFKDGSGNVISDHTVCQAYLYNASALSSITSRTSGSVYLPIPSTATTTTVQPVWTNNSASAYIRARWLLY